MFFNFFFQFFFFHPGEGTKVHMRGSNSTKTQNIDINEELRKKKKRNFGPILIVELKHEGNKI